MRNVLDKSCKENQSTYFTFNHFFFFENRAVYETMSKNVAETEGPKMTSQLAHTSCMLDKQGYMHTRRRIHTPTRSGTLTCSSARAHTCTHKYVTFVAFPLQQWLANALLCYVIRTLSVLFYLVVDDACTTGCKHAGFNQEGAEWECEHEPKRPATHQGMACKAASSSEIWRWEAKRTHTHTHTHTHIYIYTYIYIYFLLKWGVFSFVISQKLEKWC